MALRDTLRVGVFSCAVLLGAVPCMAWTVSGQVTNSNMQGIQAVDLDFEDQSIGQIIFTPNDDTDSNGNYSTTVPTGTYRIFFNAPPGSGYFDGRLDDEVINSDRVIDMTLSSGIFVSGFVKDTNGVGLFNVDLNFYDAVTGVNMGSVDDNTDVSGFYNVLAEPNKTYNILYRPPLGDPHVAHQANGVVVGTSNVSRPDVVLATGFFVSGSVFREGTNNPVQSADIDVENSTTGDPVVVGFDNTDGNGIYQVVLPAGTYDMLANPPAGQGLAGQVEPNVVVTANTVVDTIFLPVGFTLSGDVKDGSNAPVSNANLDVRDPVRDVEIPSTGDHSNALGQYSVVVGAGTYHLLYWPPAGMPAAAAVVKNKVISGNTVEPTVFLLPGFVVSGTVRRSGGATVAGSDIDAEQSADGFVYPTLGDDSGADGTYAIRVPSGPYSFIADPPSGSSLRPDTVQAIISANRTIDFLLDDPALTGVSDARGIDAGAATSWLGEATPTPSRGDTRVRFRVAEGAGATARLVVYTPEGRLVRVLVDGRVIAGEHSAEWDGTDADGRPVGSGVYILRLEAERFHDSVKTLLLR